MLAVIEGIEMLVFKIWTVATGLIFLVLSWRTWRFSKSLLSLQSLPSQFRFGKKANWPKVSVVIPACNEGETIESALDSMLNIDYPNLEIILVNDRSNDQTGQIIDQLSLVDPRIIPVHVNYLPDGWLGKVNALDRGVSQASAEWILVTDADVHFAPDSLKNAVAYCEQDSIDFLTAIPDVITRSPLLHVVIAQLFHQASLFFKPHRINDPSHRACYGQGAFMLLRKSTYLRSERLEWLKMEIVDDTGLALLMRRAGAKMAAVAGQNQIQLEWYPSLGSFLRGIEKNAFAFSQYSLRILMSFTSGIFAVFLGFAVAPWFTGSLPYGVFALSCLTVYLVSIRVQLGRILSLRSWTVLAFPLAFVILPLLYFRASIKTLKRGGVNWRGTFYALDSLKANQRMKLANLVFTSKDVEPEIRSS